MNPQKRIFIILVAVFFLCIYGTTWAGLLMPEKCQKLPSPPYSGATINGDFCAAKDGTGDYWIRVRLYRNNEVHLFSFSGNGNKCLCPLKPPCFTVEELLEIHKADACTIGVEQSFNLAGIPVLESIEITKIENCEDNEKAKICGKVTIRVEHGP
jgi:hypothetical protein